MNKVPVEFSYEVIKYHLYAGEYPHDQTSSTKIQRFLDFGITDFIDLTASEEKPGYTSSLPEGVMHYRFPLVDRSIQENMEQLHDIHDAINRLISARRKIYVHCGAGVDRTGVVVCCWFIYKKFSIDNAMAEFSHLWAAFPKSDQMTPLIFHRKDFVVQYADWLKQSSEKT